MGVLLALVVLGQVMVSGPFEAELVPHEAINTLAELESVAAGPSGFTVIWNDRRYPSSGAHCATSLTSTSGTRWHWCPTGVDQPYRARLAACQRSDGTTVVVTRRGTLFAEREIAEFAADGGGLQRFVPLLDGGFSGDLDLACLGNDRFLIQGLATGQSELLGLTTPGPKSFGALATTTPYASDVACGAQFCLMTSDVGANTPNIWRVRPDGGSNQNGLSGFSGLTGVTDLKVSAADSGFAITAFARTIAGWPIAMWTCPPAVTFCTPQRGPDTNTSGLFEQVNALSNRGLFVAHTTGTDAGPSAAAYLWFDGGVTQSWALPGLTRLRLAQRDDQAFLFGQSGWHGTSATRLDAGGSTVVAIELPLDGGLAVRVPIAIDPVAHASALVVPGNGGALLAWNEQGHSMRARELDVTGGASSVELELGPSASTTDWAAARGDGYVVATSDRVVSAIVDGGVVARRAIGVEGESVSLFSGRGRTWAVRRSGNGGRFIHQLGADLADQAPPLPFPTKPDGGPFFAQYDLFDGDAGVFLALQEEGPGGLTLGRFDPQTGQLLSTARDVPTCPSAPYGQHRFVELRGQLLLVHACTALGDAGVILTPLDGQLQRQPQQVIDSRFPRAVTQVGDRLWGLFPLSVPGQYELRSFDHLSATTLGALALPSSAHPALPAFAAMAPNAALLSQLDWDDVGHRFRAISFVLTADEDAGAPDAGQPLDAGGLDAGTADSGQADSGTMEVNDGGPLDAGGPDAGIADSGQADSGAMQVIDAGQLDAGAGDGGLDAGVSTGELAVGCSCTSALPTMWFGLVGLVIRRRRRVARW